MNVQRPGARRAVAAALMGTALVGLVALGWRDLGPAEPGPACADGRFRCGRTQTFRGTTVGSPRHDFSTADYTKLYCWPPTADRDRAGERVYEIDLGTSPSAEVYLDSGEIDLELAAIAGACPQHDPREHGGRPEACRETWPHRRHVTLSAAVARRWLVVVDGVDGREGPFALGVTCRE